MQGRFFVRCAECLQPIVLSTIQDSRTNAKESLEPLLQGYYGYFCVYCQQYNRRLEFVDKEDDKKGLFENPV
jgi:hypothetical protein